MNRYLENQFEHFLAPLAGMSHLFAGKDYSGFVETAYKHLLKNHPHDSIGGCSTDKVHAQMEDRFSHAEDINKAVNTAVIESFAGHILADYKNIKKDENLFAVFNPQSFPVKKVIKISVPLHNYPGNFTLRGIKVSSLDNRPIPASLLISNF